MFSGCLFFSTRWKYLTPSHEVLWSKMQTVFPPLQANDAVSHHYHVKRTHLLSPGSERLKGIHSFLPLLLLLLLFLLLSLFLGHTELTSLWPQLPLDPLFSFPPKLLEPEPAYVVGDCYGLGLKRPPKISWVWKVFGSWGCYTHQWMNSALNVLVGAWLKVITDSVAWEGVFLSPAPPCSRCFLATMRWAASFCQVLPPRHSALESAEHGLKPRGNLSVVGIGYFIPAIRKWLRQALAKVFPHPGSFVIFKNNFHEW